jgi:hypothetical protein
MQPGLPSTVEALNLTFTDAMIKRICLLIFQNDFRRHNNTTKTALTHVILIQAGIGNNLTSIFCNNIRKNVLLFA